MRIVMLDQLSFDACVDVVESLEGKLCVVFKKCVERSKQVLGFIDGIGLDKLLVLLNDFADEGLNRLQ